MTDYQELHDWMHGDEVQEAVARYSEPEEVEQLSQDVVEAAQLRMELV